MGLYRRGSVYWCRWRIVGSQVRESTGTADRAKAQEYHDRRRADLWRSDKLGEHRVSWDEAALAWIEEHARGKKSYSNDLLKLRWLHPRLTGCYLDAINPELLMKIRDAKINEGRTPATANKHLATISAVLHFAARKLWLKSIPWIPYLREPEGRILWLTKEVAAALVGELPKHLAQMARFSLATGVRRSNCTGLEWQNVDLSRRVAWVWGDEAKASKAIPIPLNDDAVAVLQERLGIDPRWVFTYRKKPVMRTKTKAFDAAAKRAGCPEGFTWHGLRHTWATWHVMAGTPLEVLKELGAWASYEMVLRYAHFSPGYLAGYADRVVTNSVTPDFVPDANSLKTGVADGIRTHDNWNHKKDATKVIQLDQAVTSELRAARRLKTG